jgi:hypothetical protein
MTFGGLGVLVLGLSFVLGCSDAEDRDGERGERSPAGAAVSSHTGFGAADAISVSNATYGGNCEAPLNNVGWDVGPFCDGWARCEYVVSIATLEDPSPGCDKTFIVNYRCGGVQNRTAALQAGEADGHSVVLECP